MRSFFVPIEREKLKNAILKVLFEIEIPHYGMETWTVNEQGNSIQFSRNFVHTYVLVEGETHKDSETAEKFRVLNQETSMKLQCKTQTLNVIDSYELFS